MIVTSTSWPTCPYKGTTSKISIIMGHAHIKGLVLRVQPSLAHAYIKGLLIVLGGQSLLVHMPISTNGSTCASTVGRCTSLDHFKPLSVQFGANYCDINFVHYNLKCCVRWMLFALHFWGNSTHVGVAISVFQSANWILMQCLAEIHFLFSILFF